MKEDGGSSNNRDSRDREKYAVIAVYAFIVIAAGFAVVMIIRWIFDFISEKRYSEFFRVLTPVIYGVVISYLLNPVLLFYEKRIFHKIKKKTSRILSLVSTYISAAVIITLLILMVVPQVLSSINQLTGIVTDWFSPSVSAVNSNNDGEDIENNEDNENNKNNKNNEYSITNPGDSEDIAAADENLLRNSKIGVFLTDFADSVQNYIDRLGLDLNIEETINNMIPDITVTLMNLGRNSIASVFNVTFAIVSGFASGLWNIILGLLLSVYLLIGKDRFVAQLKKLLFAIFPNRFSYRLLQIMRRTHEIFGGFITGKVVESFILGIICFIVMSVFRIQYAVLISVIVAITNVIPFFGSFLGAIISIFFLIIVDIRQAVIFTIIILVLQQFDGNFLGPKILGPKVGLPAFLIICAVLIMGGLYGFLGMVIGVPIFAVIYVLIKEYAENRLERKGFPVKTEYYIKNIAGSESFNDIIGGEEDYKSNIGKGVRMNMRSENSVNESSGNKSIISAISKAAKNISGKYRNNKIDKSNINDKDNKDN